MRFSDKRDTERKALKAIYHLALEDPDCATYIQNVSAATGLGLKELQDACKALQKAGYVERTNFRIALTETGIAYSEKLIEQGQI